MAEHDYRSTADLLNAEKNRVNDQGMSELFKALIQGKQARQAQADKVAQQQQFLEPYLSGDQKLPKGVQSVTFDGSGIHKQDELANELRQQRMAQTDDKAVSSEANMARDKYTALVAPHLSRIHAADASEDFIKQNNYVGYSQEQITNAKAAVGQRLAASEIAQVNNPSAAASLRGKFAKWTSDSNAPVFTPEEQHLMLQVNDTNRKHAIESYNKDHQMFMSGLKGANASRAKTLGRLDEIMSPLEAYKAQQIAPQQQQSPTTTASGAKMNVMQPEQGGGLANLIGRGLKAGANMFLGNSQPSYSTPAMPAAQAPAQNNPYSGIVPPAQQQPAMKQVRQKSTGKLFNVAPDGSMTEAE